MKIVIVSEIGSGFGLSNEMYEKLIELGIDYYESEKQIKKCANYTPFICEGDSCFGKYWSNFYKHEFRTNPLLVKAVEESEESHDLGLKVIEIPDDVKWEIEEQEMGNEIVREVSRYWY